jgi:hypothetical protein
VAYTPGADKGGIDFWLQASPLADALAGDNFDAAELAKMVIGSQPVQSGATISNPCSN